MTLLFPLIYSAALFFLIWKAFTVMSNGWSAYDKDKKNTFKSNNQRVCVPLNCSAGSLPKGEAHVLPALTVTFQ